MKRRDFLVGGGALAAAGAGAAYLEVRRMGSMDEYDAAVASTRASLAAQPDTRELIRFATLAANGHNTQPWRFRIRDGGIEILPDLTRRTPVVDPDDHHLFASLGCAVENLSLAAGARGRGGDIGFDPSNDGSVTFAFGATSNRPSVLCDAIPHRQSTRGEYDGRTVSAADLQTLASAAAMPGVDLVLITERQQIERVRDLVLAGNTAQMADESFMRELKRWLRFSPRQAVETGDGLFSATTGNPAIPAWLGPLMIKMVLSADRENDKYARQMRSSAGIAVFVSERNDKEGWVRAGRSCQRFALQATALGLKHAFLNQPVEVAHLRPELAALVGLPGRRPDILMRFGYGAALPFSARRPVDAVLV